MLRAAQLFRGVGTLTPEDARTRRALLTYCGLSILDAERLMAANPNRVHELLLYVIYRMTASAHPLEFPGKYLKEVFERGDALEDQPGFRRWLLKYKAEARRLLDRAGAEASPSSAALPGTATELRLDVCSMAPADEIASPLWDAIRAEARGWLERDGTPTARGLLGALDHFAPFQLRDQVLVLAASNDFFRRLATTESAAGALDAAARSVSDGAVTRVNIEMAAVLAGRLSAGEPSSGESSTDASGEPSGHE